jgi:hypothetical protein
LRDLFVVAFVLVAAVAAPLLFVRETCLVLSPPSIIH